MKEENEQKPYEQHQEYVDWVRKKAAENQTYYDHLAEQQQVKQLVQ